MIICQVDFLLTPDWVRPSSDFCVRMIFRLDRDLGFCVKKKKFASDPLHGHVRFFLDVLGRAVYDQIYVRVGFFQKFFY
jgi:hypothetical protein